MIAILSVTVAWCWLERVRETWRCCCCYCYCSSWWWWCTYIKSEALLLWNCEVSFSILIQMCIFSCFSLIWFDSFFHQGSCTKQSSKKKMPCVRFTVLFKSLELLRSLYFAKQPVIFNLLKWSWGTVLHAPWRHFLCKLAAFHWFSVHSSCLTILFLNN